MLRATTHQLVPLQVVAADGNTGLFARATVYAGSLVAATLQMPHIAQGIYGTTFLSDVEGYFSALYEFFTDSGFTTPAPYDRAAETVEVSSDKTNLVRLLGLSHDNVVLDQQQYDNAGNLTAVRLRSYDSMIDAQQGTSNGLLYTYLISATYVSGRLTKYLVTRDS